ncbi:unnamed protein product [Closterium sp. NIES-54]
MQHHAPPCTTMYHHAPPCTTMHHHAPPCNTMHHHATPCNTMHHHAPPCTTMQHHAPPCNTMHHHAPPCTTMQHHAPPCTTMHHHAPPCNAMQGDVPPENEIQEWMRDFDSNSDGEIGVVRAPSLPRSLSSIHLPPSPLFPTPTYHVFLNHLEPPDRLSPGALTPCSHPVLSPCLCASVGLMACLHGEQEEFVQGMERWMAQFGGGGGGGGGKQHTRRQSSTK